MLDFASHMSRNGTWATPSLMTRTHPNTADTFSAVSRDIIKRPIAPLSTGRITCIRIFAGRHDPYFAPKTDIDLWKTIFPEASIRIENGGHMLPFEILAAEWLDSSFAAPAEANPAP